MRLLRYGRLHLIRNENGRGTLSNGGYRLIYVNGKRVYEHVHIAEKALGKSLPKGAIVHHINGMTSDNRSNNLVVCPSQAYHLLLHRNKEKLT
jgi:hypothetical protein